jgi:hypothetical protein
MKKSIRILGVTLSLVVLASCTDPNEGDGGPDTTLSVASLKGTYKYTGISVAKAVDLNKDGVFNNDLERENYKPCLFDNTIEITDTQYTFQMKGTQCDPSETNLVFTYTLDKTLAKITLFDNGQPVGDITNVSFNNFNNLKTYVYRVYNTVLQQDISYGMEAI